MEDLEARRGLVVGLVHVQAQGIVVVGSVDGPRLAPHVERLTAGKREAENRTQLSLCSPTHRTSPAEWELNIAPENYQLLG